MKADDIRKHINELNIGSDDDYTKLKKEFIDKLAADPEEFSAATEALEELSVEINERLAQVEDEDRAAALERKLKLVEESSAEVAELAKKAAEEPAKPRTVLIVDESEERQGETKRTVPVALDGSENAGNSNAPDNGKNEKAASAKKENASGKNDKSDWNSKGSDKQGDQKKLEKEAAELIKKSQKEQKEREQEQKKLEKEQQKQEAQAEKDSDSSKDDGKASNKDGSGSAKSGTKTSGQDIMNEQLVLAMTNYMTKNFTEARESLKVLANAKNMSKEDMGYARYLYGRMLYMGEGGPEDKKAAEFWFKEAAKCKNSAALFTLGMIAAEEVPATKEQQVEIVAKVLKYFERSDKAAEDGNEAARSKYIEICEAQPIYRGARQRACAYCDAFAAQKSDAYEKKQCDDRKEKIRENYKTNNAAMYSGRGAWIKNWKDVCVLVGALIALVANLFIFMTVQNKGDMLPKVITLDGMASGKLDEIIEIIAAFTAKIIGSIAEVFADTTVNVIMPGTLLFGLLLLLLGRFLIGFESYQGRGKLAEAACEISAVATLMTLFGNVVMYIFPGGSMLYFGGAAAIGVLMIAILIVARILAAPFRK